jgi:hypothetical protein
MADTNFLMLYCIMVPYVANFLDDAVLLVFLLNLLAKYFQSHVSALE